MAQDTPTEPPVPAPAATVFEGVEVLTPEGVTFDYDLAGIGARFFGALVDVCVLSTAIVLTGWGVALVGGAALPTGFMIAILFTAIFALLFFYIMLMELFTRGRTVGKFATRTRVVGVDGGEVTPLQCAVRGLSWPFEVLLFPIFALGSAMISRRSQRLGDLGAGTLVIRTTKRPREGIQATPTAAAYAPDAPFRTWDVTAVDNETVMLVRHFLERRTRLAPDARRQLASEFAARVRSQVSGPDATWPDELLLEAVVAAKILRDDD
ncbi:MAG: RDD family protein [Acidimicrobiia bacterium]